MKSSGVPGDMARPGADAAPIERMRGITSYAGLGVHILGLSYRPPAHRR